MAAASAGGMPRAQARFIWASASTARTVCPRRARVRARSAARVVLPTPPLPVTTMRDRSPASSADWLPGWNAVMGHLLEGRAKGTDSACETGTSEVEERQGRQGPTDPFHGAPPGPAEGPVGALRGRLTLDADP